MIIEDDKGRKVLTERSIEDHREEHRSKINKACRPKVSEIPVIQKSEGTRKKKNKSLDLFLNKGEV